MRVIVNEWFERVQSVPGISIEPEGDYFVLKHGVRRDAVVKQGRVVVYSASLLPFLVRNDDLIEVLELAYDKADSMQVWELIDLCDCECESK